MNKPTIDDIIADRPPSNPMAGHTADNPFNVTSRIKVHHAMQGPVWRWMVTVDKRAPEAFISHADAMTFASGVDIGHASDSTLLRQRNELVAALEAVLRVADRKTDVFDTAHAVLASIQKEEKP